jgi:hypothetical protein
MKARLSIFALACLAVTSNKLSAQTSGPVRFELGGGASFLTGNDRSYFKDGYNVLAGVAVQTPLPQLEVLGTAFYHGFGGKWKSDQVVVGAPDTLRLGDFSVLAGTIGARWRFIQPTSAARVRPYMTLGAGVYRIESEAELYGNRVNGADTKFGGTFGLGFDMPLGTSAAFVEARVHNVFTDAGSSRLYPVTVGFRF